MKQERALIKLCLHKMNERWICAAAKPTAWEEKSEIVTETFLFYLLKSQRGGKVSANFIYPKKSLHLNEVSQIIKLVF